MGRIYYFNDYKTKLQAKQLKNKIFVLAQTINAPDSFIINTTFSDDLFELNEAFSLYERLYHYSVRLNIQNTFNYEIDNLIKNLETYSASFMFPTTLSKYRRGINPVKALFNEVQKFLLLENLDDPKQQFVLNLFNDKKWFKELIKSIDTDCDAIVSFLKLYQHNDIEKLDSKLIELNQFRQDLLNYKKTFKSIYNWQKRNTKVLS